MNSRQRLKTWFRNRKGIRGSTARVPKNTRERLPQATARRKPNRNQILMGVLGDEYNDGIRDAYDEWKKTASKKEIERTPLIKYRVDCATDYLKTASPETLEEVEEAWKKAPGAKSLQAEVTLGPDAEKLDEEGKAEALRVARAERFEE